MREQVDVLQRLLDDGRAWVALGQIRELTPSTDGGWRLTCARLPGEDLIEARPLWPQASGAGLFFPLAVGDEVVLLLPGGDPLQAVALPGPVSRPAPAPATWLPTAPLLVHPQGVEVRRTGALPAQPVVLEALLPALAGALTELATALAGLGAPPTPQTTALAAQLATDFRALALRSE
ncbi:MAG: hypothetical protein JNM72_12045 [Deltaproteobacteria bacterium]|nr:hypothetical protein [Deltaproteobacteria bacterium]